MKPEPRYYWSWRNANGTGWVLDKTLMTSREAYIKHKDKDEYMCNKYLTPGYLEKSRRRLNE